MTPSLSIRRGWSDAEWDRELLRWPEATIFHSRIWAGIVRDSFPRLRDLSTWFDGPTGAILLPLFAWRRAGGLLTTFHTSFPFLYGGPVPSRGPDGEEPMTALLRALPGEASRGHTLPSFRWTGNPFSPDPEVAVLPPGFTRGRETTHVLPLPAAEEDFWERILTPAKRNDVRRLGKKGVLVEEAHGEESSEVLYRFYLDSFARWGGRPALVYPPDFYKNLLRLDGGALRLTVARRDGRILGGTFTLRWNGKVHYLAGYFDHESRVFRPNVLIQVDSILQAIRDGHAHYDFLPSGGHRSVAAFKEGFGGVETAFPLLERRGLLHRLVERTRRTRRT